MKALHVGTNDRWGGAAIAAYRLHLGLLKVGVKSRIIASRKTAADPNVEQASPTELSIADRLRAKLITELRAWRTKKYRATRSSTLEIFSDDRVPGRDWLSEHLPTADVYNLHWVAGFLDHERFFKRLPAATPLVWTLHDMNPFTGGCHYTLGCDRFVGNCGRCHQLGSSREFDISAKILHRKHRALASLCPETTRIVATSKWMYGEARSSSLFSRFDIERIPNSLDTDIFVPRRRKTARELFDLPTDAKVILFVAESIGNHRKGFDLLQAALLSMKASDSIVLAAIGHSHGIDAQGTRLVNLGRIENERMMSFAMSAADIFVMPTRAEAFGQVVFEAMACGTPVVGFDVGGIPDMVRPGETGLLALPEDVSSLKRAIETLLDDDELRATMSRECRRIALEEYSLEIQGNRYKALYEDLVEKSCRLRQRSSSFAVAAI